jgi:serine/arginine repetitive matrix protein 2
VYETIEEESAVPSSSPSPAKPSPDGTIQEDLSVVQYDSVYIVDPETTSMVGEWDDEHGIMAMRKYYALRDEAHDTVTESKKVWVDTPFSIFAMQCKFTSNVM